MSAELFESLQQLQIDAPITLWTIDNSANGGTVYRFHSSNANGVTTDLDHDGITYTATPIEVTGIEQTGRGKPRPKMAIGTAQALSLGLLEDPDILLGAKCTRIKTLAKYMDDGAEPDSTAVWPTAVFYVERLEEYTDEVAVYQLADPSDLPRVQIPRRVALANLCTACYRDESCQYAGDPVTDSDGASFGAGPFTDRGAWSDATSDYVADDYVSLTNPDGVEFVWTVPSGLVGSVPTGTRPGSVGSSSYWVLDTCLKRISDCELRFNADTVGLNFSAFPGIDEIP